MKNEIIEAFEKDYQVCRHLFDYRDDGYYHTTEKNLEIEAVTLNRILHGYRKGYKTAENKNKILWKELEENFRTLFFTAGFGDENEAWEKHKNKIMIKINNS